MRALILFAAAAAAVFAAGPSVTLDLRTRVEPFKGSGEWREVRVAKECRCLANHRPTRILDPLPQGSRRR
jgi:hypothetical protein